MPLTGIDSYPPAISAFLAHWAQVNTALGGGGLVLTDGYTVANLATDYAGLNTAIVNCQTTDNAMQVAAGNREISKTFTMNKLREFRAAGLWQLRRGPYKDALPKLPRPRSDREDFLRPMNDMLRLWTAINADSSVPGFTPPLLLLAGYAIATFTTDLNTLKTRYGTHDGAVLDAKVNRERRDALLPPLRAHIIEYRAAVLASFGAGHPLVTSLPAITPAPGSTPTAVNLSGVWESVPVKASLTCTAPTGPNLDHLSVRYSPSPYRKATETVVQNIPVTQLNFLTDYGLGAPGSSADFKFYVVTTTGNEKGSNTVRVTRPV